MRALHYGNQVLNIEPYNVHVLRILIQVYFSRQEYATVYGYIQRVLSCPQHAETEKLKLAVVRKLSILAPWFRMVPKLRVILPKMEQQLKDESHYELEWFRWAQEYKKWYEQRLILGENLESPEVS